MELRSVGIPGASGTISDDVVATIVRQAFGSDARVREVMPLGGGQVNDTMRLSLADGGACVLRIAPGEVASSAALS